MPIEKPNQIQPLETASPSPNLSSSGHRLFSRRLTAAAVGAVLTLWLGIRFLHAGDRPPGIGDPAPEISGTPWINSPPLTAADLRGKVVLVEFWTYG